MSYIEPLEAISPLDGRYREIIVNLAEKFSEEGLINRRGMVEIKYLILLTEKILPDLAAGVKMAMGPVDLNTQAARRVKEHEARTNHDVAALVLVLQEIVLDRGCPELAPLVHNPLTSEDTNNLSYALQLRDALEEDIIPALKTVYDLLREHALTWADHPMLARTHGQPASPTTLGKEYNIFAQRLKRQLDQLLRIEMLVKFNGASGNYNAHVLTFPEIDWVEFTKEFVESFNFIGSIRFVSNFVTTQIESHDTFAELFDLMKRICTVLTDCCQDTWRYISDEWIIQKVMGAEVGSSTMPHKVNPINFENAEGNLMKATALFEMFSRELPRSRLQRHLSDSTIIRSFGEAFGHLLVALKSIEKGLKKIEANPKKMLDDLNKHPEVISEVIQTVLRREGLESAYDDVKKAMRGRKLSLAEIWDIVDGMKVGDEVKKKLRGLTPKSYIGLAPQLARLEQ